MNNPYRTIVKPFVMFWQEYERMLIERGDSISETLPIIKINDIALTIEHFRALCKYEQENT